MLNKFELKYYKDITRIADSLVRIANALEAVHERDEIIVQEIEESLEIEMPEDEEAGIGVRIKERLEEIGMSQRELANACNVTDTSMSRYIRGTRIPKATLIIKIAAALGCSVEWLLGMRGKEDE